MNSAFNIELFLREVVTTIPSQYQEVIGAKKSGMFVPKVTIVLLAKGNEKALLYELLRLVKG